MFAIFLRFPYLFRFYILSAISINQVETLWRPLLNFYEQYNEYIVSSHLSKVCFLV